MSAEDERLVLTEIARRHGLQLQDVVARLLESVAHALSFAFLAAKRLLAPCELARKSAPKNAHSDGDAGGCSRPLQNDLSRKCAGMHVNSTRFIVRDRRIVDGLDEAGAFDDPDHVRRNGTECPLLLGRKRMSRSVGDDCAEWTRLPNHGYGQKPMRRGFDAHRTHLRQRVARGHLLRDLQLVGERQVPEAGWLLKRRQGRLEEKDRTAVGAHFFGDGLAGRVENLAWDACLHHLRESLEHLRHQQSRLAVGVPFDDGCSVPSGDSRMRSAKLALPIQTVRSKSLRFLLETT